MPVGTIWQPQFTTQVHLSITGSPKSHTMPIGDTQYSTSKIWLDVHPCVMTGIQSYSYLTWHQGKWCSLQPGHQWGIIKVTQWAMHRRKQQALPSVSESTRRDIPLNFSTYADETCPVPWSSHTLLLFSMYSLTLLLVVLSAAMMMSLLRYVMYNQLLDRLEKIQRKKVTFTRLQHENI